MQAIIVFFAVMSAIAAPVLSFIDPYEYTDATYYTMMVAALLSLIGMEFLLLYARRSENRSYMRLIVFITLINAVDRIFNGYLLRSFSQY
jgi:divalent metal cation (Fe/Co/Zn/Cd) transporter